MNATAAEAASQPDVWQTAIARAAQFRDTLIAPRERVLVVGCGTSAFVAQSYAYLRERAGLGETDAAYASELFPARRYDRVIAITRSGTTTEILDVLRGLPAGTRRVAVTATRGQAVEDLVEECVALDFADERSVVQTRFPTTVLALLRAALGRSGAEAPVSAGVRTIADGQTVADGRTAVQMPLPIDPTKFEHFVFLGSGWTVGLAHEAALKIREMTQGWSESYPAMDFRHGPVAAAGPRTLVWIFGDAPRSLIRTATDAGATVYSDHLDPLAQLVLVHRLALVLAAHRGLDPDQPRLLTRSVILTPASAPGE